MDTEGLPGGSYVRPIRPEYIPKESWEKLGLVPESFSPDTFAICYTKKGLKVIRWTYISEV